MTDQDSPTPTTTVLNAPLVSDETYSRLQMVLLDIAGCGSDIDLHNKIIPSVRIAGIPPAFHERIVQAVQRKLKFWDSPIPVGKLRALLFPPALPRTDGGLPEWAAPFCWVTSQDAFFNTSNGEFMSLRSFDIAYGRMMPIGESGRRLSAAEKCTQHWGMPIVERVGYRPDCGPFYQCDGVSFANDYSPSSLPSMAVAYSEAGLAGINAFFSMLRDMCSRRDDVFDNLLYWMAHNVQKPGVKIRWAPILKGVHGDGKTLAASFLRAAMGYRNVRTTSNSNISNSGGFTDWAVRGAVNVIEEIMLTGKARHQLYNSMKEFISNNIVDVNVKGGQPRQHWNCTNHWANTNHNDAIPMEPTDRRWFVIFTPWASLDDMRAYCGLNAAAWKERTDAIDYAKDHCAGELRKWFLSIDIPATFDVNGSAMMTPEKLRMMASSKDDAESAAKAIISEGTHGVTARVFSSAHLRRALQTRALGGGFTVPETTAFGHMLTRLGYSKSDGYVKWKGETCTIWLQNGVELTNEQARLELDSFQPNFQPS